MKAYIRHPAMPDELQMELDPERIFRDVNPSHLLDACGLIPGWIVEGLSDPDMADKSLYEIVEESYNFGPMYPFPEMDITDDMELISLKYPEDAPYKPFLKVAFKSSYMIQFDHAMLAFIEPDGNTTVVRCD
jgi:hypothetical protein